MAEIVGIRFKREGKQYYFDPHGLQIAPGDGVILETSWGVEFGTCARGNSEVAEAELVAPLRPILRLATQEDYKTLEKNQKLERQAMELCLKKIDEHQLDMKLVDVEYSFEGTKILFFFTSEGRVDFRALVKDLAAAFHTRIELRQIGVRDEAKMLGGLGICGRPFCCASFLREFQPVSIKMAKTQSLSLNPTKISGTCGRLMCCLKYEQHAYEDLLKTSPRSDSFVETPDGVGDIINVQTLRERVRVRLDNEPDSLKTYHNSEIRVVRPGKGRRPEGYIPPSPAELAKLRRPEIHADEAAPAPDALQQYISALPEPTPEAAPPRGEERRSRRSRGGQRKENRPPEAKAEPKTEQKPRSEARPPRAPRHEPKPKQEQKPRNEPKPQPEQDAAALTKSPAQEGKKPRGNQRRGRKPDGAAKAEKPIAAAPPADKPAGEKPAGDKPKKNYWRRRPHGGKKDGGGPTAQS